MASELIDAYLLKLYDTNLKTVAELLQRSYSYSVGDKVHYKGKYLKCKTAGTTDLNTLTALDTAVIGDILTDGTVEWEVVTNDNGAGISNWSTNTNYKVGNLVLYSDKIYKCITEHTSDNSSFDNDKDKWTEVSATKISNWISEYNYSIDNVVMYDNSTGINNWVTNTNYSINDKVVYDNNIYECIIANNDSVFNKTNWNKIDNVENIMYRCKIANNDTNFTKSNWERINGKSYQLATKQSINNLFI